MSGPPVSDCEKSMSYVAVPPVHPWAPSVSGSFQYTTAPLLRFGVRPSPGGGGTGPCRIRSSFVNGLPAIRTSTCAASASVPAGGNAVMRWLPLPTPENE